MANNVIKRTWNQNKMVCIEDLSGMVFQSESGGHTFEISGVNDTGAVSLSGTVEARFLRADNVKVTIAGTISSGKASVTLTSDCYTVGGRFSLTIFVTSNSQKVAVYSAVGNVVVTDGVASGTVPPLVTDSIQTGSITASGNATIGGVLDVTQRRCYGALSSAGWYRVLAFNGTSANDANGNAGSQIDITIIRDNGVDRPENHNIRFHLVAGNIKFDSENSVSTAMLIDKIRYSRDGNFGYIDINYNLSSANNVTVDYTVHDTPTRQYLYISGGLSPAPAGGTGTVITTYSFSPNETNKTVLLSAQTINSGYFVYQDVAITSNSKVQITQCYASGETLGLFYITQPRSGDVVVYCRTSSGANPTDGSKTSVFLTIDNR